MLWAMIVTPQALPQPLYKPWTSTYRPQDTKHRFQVLYTANSFSIYTLPGHESPHAVSNDGDASQTGVLRHEVADLLS